MNQPPPDLEQRLSAVNAQLDALKKERAQSEVKPKRQSDAARAAIDFASASAVGTVLGYGIDHWLGIFPWGMLAGLVIGVGAGFSLIMKAEAAEKRRAEKSAQRQE
jgi:F0F1-type ATP synthase assembly protein I